MSKLAMIAAMEREIAPLVRGWKTGALVSGGRTFPLFEHEGVLAAVSGIGCKNAELAARAMVEQFRPSVLMSVGLAGGLIRSLKVGSVFTPSVVVDGADEAEYRCSAESSRVSGGVLVSSGEVAGNGMKEKLVNRFHALVVDMEAAGVARVAQNENIVFRCVKTISDEADFVMPPMSGFIDSSGNFQNGKFAAWAVWRPWQWAKVAALARNSRRATRVLCDWLEKDLTAGLQGKEVVTLNRAEFSQAKH
jgi:adenosylhomocysteine nucleosidase